MKMTIYNLRSAICRRHAQTPVNRTSATGCPPCGEITGRNRQSPIANRKSREGVALVVTLILLSVTLVMAVAFLAISRRARNASSTSTDTATAQLAADSALAAAQAQIAASILATNAAAYDYGLLVSTNYVNTNSLDAYYNTYFYPNGNLKSGTDLEPAIENQLILPRPPVFVANTLTGSNDFRFYLDLNRNGNFEESGWIPNTELDLSGNLFTNGFINQAGDPQWIGVLEHPDQPHGPDNRYTSRFCFFAQPIGDSLDLNYIHNQTINTSLSAADGFFRNEGVGSWEINLAAFLADLNTNEWLPTIPPDNNYYAYNQATGAGSANLGSAFDDARALLAWRYNGNYNSLAYPSASLYSALALGDVDGYTIGSLMTGPMLPVPKAPGNTTPWVGSDNPNHFFSLTSDLFDSSKTTVGVPGVNVAAGNYLTGRLLKAGNGLTTYDRYTFYRMLDQLGTDSTVDDDRMNLNYSNAVVNYDANGIVTSITIIPGAETNAVPWRPLDFFSAAADRMLRYYTTQWFQENPTNYLLTYYNITNFPPYIGKDGYGLTNTPFFGMTNQIPSFGLTNIPVYVNGQFYYSPAVNRLLQLAANMYDASTNANGVNVNGNGYPSVFRPVFYKDSVTGNVYISGYREVVSSASIPSPTTIPAGPLKDVSFLPDNFSSTYDVYGLPWIIGAKKGFPNFNQFYMRNIVQVTRKLEVWRTDPTKPGALGTNQMFIMSITNQMGCSFWNSYDTNNYPGNLTVYVRDLSSMMLTNGAQTWSTTTNFIFGPTAYGPATSPSWTSSQWGLNARGANPPDLIPQPTSFLPFNWNFEFLPESVYNAGTATFSPVGSVPDPWDTTSPVPVFPQFGLMTTNWIQAYILDGTHVIDYVQLTGPSTTRNLNQEIADSMFRNDKQRAAILNGTAMWDTNGYGTALPPPTKGVVNQIDVSRTGPSAFTVNNLWKKPPNMPDLSLGDVSLEEAEAKFFDGFFELNNAYQLSDAGPVYYNTNLVVQAPYTPQRTVWQYTLWQANDPLVHYLASDLKTITPDTGLHYSDNLVDVPMSVIHLDSLNLRYQPWGRNKQMSQVAGLENVNVDSDAYNLRYHDPLVWGSDFWDFPTYKYPTIGWLGRVHRGTPWQTVYMKSGDLLQETASAPGGVQNVGTNTWAQWTGDTQIVNVNGTSHYYDSANSAPAQDGGLFDLFTTRLNDNAVRGALSVNQTHLAAWSAVLSGVVTLSNASRTVSSTIRPAITNMIIQPAGVNGVNSQVGQIVSSIYNIRTNYVNADGVKGVFEHVGDVLRSPALSDQSPFLNWNNTSQQQYGIGDEVYEWLPQQIMGLLRVGSAPRYVVYCYGQTLRPATGGTVLSGSYFNLVTNYQVTAESAARAIVRVDRHVTSSGTNYTTTVESYNVLPPD